MINSSILIASVDYQNAAEQWLTNAIVKSIVEYTIGVNVDDEVWQFNWVEYYPVWTKDAMTKLKTVKRVYVRLKGRSEQFLEIDESQLEPYGLENYNEVIHLFQQSGATRATSAGVQIYKTRLDYH